MSKSTWLLTIKEEFAAAHYLRNYNGKCEALHGHNYGVEVVVEGNTLTQDSELLVDFSVLKKELREELAKIDHTNLNDFHPFNIINPSSENIARYLYQKLKVRYQHMPVTLYSVTIGETSKQSATYRETA